MWIYLCDGEVCGYQVLPLSDVGFVSVEVSMYKGGGGGGHYLRLKM